MPRFVSGNQVRRNVRFAPLLIILTVGLITLSTPLLYDQLLVSYQPLQEFQYSPDVDLDVIISHKRFGQSLPPSMARVRPYNPRNFKFLANDATLCHRESIEILILVKTTHGSFSQRDAIRKTWGNAKCYLQRRVRVLFLLGMLNDRWLEDRVRVENEVYGDILQQNFIDNYYNNTLKLMMGFEYFTHYCAKAKFLVLIDHDYMLNPSHLVRYVDSIHPRLYSRFIAGHVWYAAAPMRTPGNKWRLSRRDYPYQLFPNYAEAGTLILSADFAQDLYIAMQYTKYHKFDDIFLGIILHKLHIAPVHSPDIFHERPSQIPATFLSIHGFDSADDLLTGWTKIGLAKRCLTKRKLRTIGR